MNYNHDMEHVPAAEQMSFVQLIAFFSLIIDLVFVFGLAIYQVKNLEEELLILSFEIEVCP